MIDMSGKICLITGSNSGIGKETARELARLGAHVIMVARSRERGEEARDDIIESTGNRNVDLFIADLSVMREIVNLATRLKEKYKKLDVLVNNAGGINQDRILTEEGNELTLAVNHLAPFLLSHELLPLLGCSGEARIVNVSSGAHQLGKVNLEDFQNTNYGSLRAYGTAKLLNIMFTYGLARRLEGSHISVNVLHPGFVNTGFGKSNASRSRIMMMKLFSRIAKSPEKGSETSIYLASSHEVIDITGRYFANSSEKRSSKTSYDKGLQEAIWKKTEEVLGVDSWSYIGQLDEIECKP